MVKVISSVFNRQDVNSLLSCWHKYLQFTNPYIIIKYSLPHIQNMNTMQAHSKNAKRERTGRWSTAEANLFQELIQRYGKNWKKIHQHMRGRTLSQIRSHAQKFFDKVGHKKMQEYERRAKLLEALETLEKEKRLQQQSKSEDSFSQKSQEIALKKEEDVQPIHINEDQTLTAHNLLFRENGSFEGIKQQQEGTQGKKVETSNVNNSSFYQMPMIADQHGYLMHLIYVNPNAFAGYGLSIESSLENKQIQESSMPGMRF